MGKSTSRRTNAFLKSKKHERYARHASKHNGNTPVFRNEDKRRKGELTYVAVDSCILIDMMHMIAGHSRKFKDTQYFDKLQRLLDNCVFDEFGKKRKNGRIVLCLLPSVKRELSDEFGQLHSSIKNFIENRTLEIKIDENYLHSFNKKVEKLVKEYAKKGYFLDKEGQPTMDAYHFAQSSILNLTLISRDRHIIKNFRDKNPEKKVEQLKFVNRRQLNGDFDGLQAESRSIHNFFALYDRSERMPTIENFVILERKLQEQLIGDFNYRPPRRPAYDLGL